MEAERAALAHEEQSGGRGYEHTMALSRFEISKERVETEIDGLQRVIRDGAKSTSVS